MNSYARAYRAFLYESFSPWCACNLNICLTLQMRLIILTINIKVPFEIKYKDVYKQIPLLMVQ